MKTNAATRTKEKPLTHEGGKGEISRDPTKQLERAVATCLLFEDTFYERGSSIADRIADLCAEVAKKGDIGYGFILGLAQRARVDYKLRHVPLFLTVQAAKLGAPAPYLAKAVEYVIRRPDELSELLAIYWRPKKEPIPSQVKRGLAAAFRKFDEYQLAKWNRDRDIRLRDVMRLVHPKPVDEAQAAMWKRLIEDKLATPDTWEVGLTNCHTKEEKKAFWEGILHKKGTDPKGREFDVLGDMAFLMNLRNMSTVGVTPNTIGASMSSRKFSKILPFRFISASNAAPSLAQDLSDAMCRALAGVHTLDGETHLMIDISGSMDAAMSAKSQTPRWAVATALGILLRETSRCRVFTFSGALAEVANVRGLGMVSAVNNSQQHGGTYLGQALVALSQLTAAQPPARVIVITDEQAHDSIPAMIGGKTKGYIVNVAPYAVGVETGGNGWQRINGFSERILDWIALEETGAIPEL